jgi:hypothetical protein
MTTRIWSFLPVDMHHVPSADATLAAVTWLRIAMPAYKVEAVDHGKIAFFDCGGNMGATLCPECRTEMGAQEWSDWMTKDYSETDGFRFSTRRMSCCGVSLTLDRIVFENLCMFGRFGIAVTDTMKTYSEDDMNRFATELADRLGCSIRYLEAHY